MAFEDNGMILPVTPMNNGGYGGFGGDWSAWIVLFLLFGMFNGGWGGGFGGNQLGYDFPWLLNGQNNTDTLISNGFQNNQISNQLNGIQSAVTSGFGDVQTALCSGFAGVNASVNGAQNALAQQLYTNQIADLERSYAAQTAQMQGMNALQSQFANCCCENRLATCQTQNTIQNEGNATRFADANNTRDIITNQTSNTQAILDKLCALEMDGYKRENDNLRQQLNMATLAASQNAQTAAIQAGQRALASEVEQYVNPTPIPSYNVPNPFCCNNTNYGCGCGM